jgi:transmembrane sensor
MITPEIENLIVKYITQSINAKELDVLVDWIQTKSNVQEFKRYDKTHYTIIFSMNELDSDKIKEELLLRIRKDKSIYSKLKVRSILKYAAIAIVFISVGYFYQDFSKVQSVNDVVPQEEFITLQLDDGNIKIISEDGTSKVKDKKGNIIGRQNGLQLVYDDATKVQKLVYNTLNIPYGKRFELMLSDGTKVHLNAGTSLKYPVKFLTGEKRHVFLSGEAYFDVAENEENPFIVNADDLNIQVLGTEFNVSTYPEDLSTDVVLVEGSVSLYTGKENDVKSNTLLEPGFAGSFNKKGKNISTKPVVTSIYTAWIYGELVFRNITFSSILKKMERHYNVKITNTNLKLTDEKFNASFGDEPIEKILNYFEITYGVEFTIEENNEIIIN